LTKENLQSTQVMTVVSIRQAVRGIILMPIVLLGNGITAQTGV